MADFAHGHAFTRLWLQSITAYAYNLREAEALEALDKVEALDPSGKLGAAGSTMQRHAERLTPATKAAAGLETCEPPSP